MAAVKTPRILFITANRLGDAVISTGLLAELIRRNPGARITVACGPVAASLFEACPSVERVITVVKQRWDRHWFTLWQACVGTAWDLVVDLRGSAVSLFLWTRQRRILRGGRRPGPRINHIGALMKLSPPPLPVTWSTAGQNEKAAHILPHDAGSWLALAPTANWDGKIWPAERFVAVARDLMRSGLKPVVFYGPGREEQARAAPVLAGLPEARDLGGNRPIGEVAALLKRCALFVGNDSGLMHLAAAGGVPTLGLFGPSKASEYAPSGVAASHVAADGPEGSADIHNLSVETVLVAARQRLGSPEGHAAA
ncbi:lipopolysaccharide heptosyltransferase [Neoasaia chiangmaiensis NBRC 101099]|uniref:Heptosyltransferase n=1 Tax=Neoasaia chiangmaiensis TaxID=320497 RepID=A0A1U9KMI5_9PROT|nr:glycosyltransferase family 9 protein [Neoasaia chiangmaiensis]AQS87002.1 heptosyltransferase [Neoasaia chiangmaiensis]GBR37805.1 lipopolysaccharide heptosyltransferase [Neoasaia chiangmaiensis NBRC 101099]GEN15130.1 glycosyl transferase [Neoasaia chiangmaiensis]